MFKSMEVYLGGTIPPHLQQVFSFCKREIDRDPWRGTHTDRLQVSFGEASFSNDIYPRRTTDRIWKPVLRRVEQFTSGEYVRVGAGPPSQKLFLAPLRSWTWQAELSKNTKIAFSQTSMVPRRLCSVLTPALKPVDHASCFRGCPAVGWCFILRSVLMFPKILTLLSGSLCVCVIMGVPLEALSVFRGVSSWLFPSD